MNGAIRAGHMLKFAALKRLVLMIAGRYSSLGMRSD
jgi:hypothetical protein